MGAYEKNFESCIGDTNNDGAVNVTDLLAVISAWGACGSPCPTDVAPGGPCGVGTDGVTDVLDMLAVIGSWGECEESLTGGGGGEIDFAAVLVCLLQAEELGLEGEDFDEFMQACLEQAGLLD